MSENQKGCSPSDCQGCAHARTCNSKPQDFHKPANAKSHIRNVIAVVSGKGGVGKSMVTASLARMMREQGFSVGILDADITGPSIPKMYGIHDTAKGSDDGIFPEIAKDGTKIMSVNLLLPNESDPVIWRAPIITSVVTQFWTDVIWGDLDYLFVDMPPGTGCSTYSIPVTSGEWSSDRNISTGSCAYDCRESLQDGKTDEYSSARNRRELQLSDLPGLWKEDFRIWRKPYR